MKQKVSISTALLITVIIFLVLLVVTRLFKIEDLPIQTVGVLFGGVITALITYFLLLGQTRAEENKEKSMKVFEKKSEKYEDFINKIWEVWEDRTIDLLELSEVLKLLAKDVMLYANVNATSKVLDSLTIISDLTTPDESKKDKGTTQRIQKEVFNIVKTLAEDLELGGSLNEKMSTKLQKIEDRVYPALEKREQERELKKYQNQFSELIKRHLEDSDVNIDNISYDPKFWSRGLLKGRINESKVNFELFDLNKKDVNSLEFKFYVDKWAPNYAEKGFKEGGYGARNWRQTTIKNSIKKFDKILSFTDYHFLMNKLKKNSFDEIVEEFATALAKHIQNWKNNEGKSVLQIIEECEPNKKELK